MLLVNKPNRYIHHSDDNCSNRLNKRTHTDKSLNAQPQQQPVELIARQKRKTSKCGCTVHRAHSPCLLWLHFSIISFKRQSIAVNLMTPLFRQIIFYWFNSYYNRESFGFFLIHFIGVFIRFSMQQFGIIVRRLSCHLLDGFQCLFTMIFFFSVVFITKNNRNCFVLFGCQVKSSVSFTNIDLFSIEWLSTEVV